MVRSQKDLHRVNIASVPSDKKGQARLQKKITKIEVEPDQILCMIDSGSFVHAIDATVELPTHVINDNKPDDKHTVAETACGGKLHKLGSVQVDCEADSVDVRIDFDHMKVKTPILSVRKLIRDHHDVCFPERVTIFTV